MLSIIIPVYKNEDTLQALTDKIIQQCRNSALSCEIVFVNDGSPDDSLILIKRLMRQYNEVNLVDNPINVGQQKSIYLGLNYANGNTFAVMDADLQNDPSDLLAMYFEMKNKQYDVVFSCSYNAYQARLKMISSYIYKGILSILFSIPFRSTSFVVFNREAHSQVLAVKTRYFYITGFLANCSLYKGVYKCHKQTRVQGESAYNFTKRLKVATHYFLGLLEFKWKKRIN